MRREPTYSRGVINLLLMVLLLIAAVGCGGRKSNGGLIPRSDLVPILADIYLADGLMTLPEVQMRHAMKDSIEIYDEVLEGHGYTREQLDNTMRHFFDSRPRRLERIHDEVLAKLSEKESRLVAEMQMQDSLRTNYWVGEELYTFPPLHREFDVLFEMLLPETGLYRLTLTATIFRDDQSLNPRISLYFIDYLDDETVKIPIEEVPLIRDGQPHNYEIFIDFDDETIPVIRGRLFNHDRQELPWEKRGQVTNIRLVQLSSYSEDEELTDPFIHVRR